MSPLTLESFAGAPAATLQSVLVGGLFCEFAVTCRQIRREQRSSGCICLKNQKFDFKTFTTKLNMRNSIL